MCIHSRALSEPECPDSSSKRSSFYPQILQGDSRAPDFTTTTFNQVLLKPPYLGTLCLEVFVRRPSSFLFDRKKIIKKEENGRQDLIGRLLSRIVILDIPAGRSTTDFRMIHLRFIFSRLRFVCVSPGVVCGTDPGSGLH